MTNIASMTGFAESTGSHEGLRWRWEAKSVNSRSLDLRLRTPPGFDGLEPAARKLAAERFQRGAFQISLSVESTEAGRGLVLDAAALASAVKSLAPRSLVYSHHDKHRQHDRLCRKHGQP